MYIGNDLQIAHPSYRIIDDISSGFNGSTTSFALQVSGATPVPFPISTQQVMISVNGVVQEPDPTGSAGFKLLGSNIVFSSAPANGHAFFGVINAGADYVTAGSEFPDGSATAPSFTFQDDQDTGWFRSGSGAVGYSANGAQTLTFDGNGLTVTGDASFVGDSSKNLLWDKSDGALEFADNAKAVFGTGSDLQIWHDGSNSKISDVGTGDLQLLGANVGIYSNAGESMVVGIANGAVELYHNGLKTLYTDSLGVSVKGGDTSSKTQLSIWGNEGQRGVLQISADDGDDNADHWQFQARTDGNLNIQNLNSGSWGNSAVFEGGGPVNLYYGNVKVFNTDGNGIMVKGPEGGTANVYIYADEGDDDADKWSLTSGTDGTFTINNRASGGFEKNIECNGNGNVELYYDNNLRLATNNDGITLDNNAAQSTIYLKASGTTKGYIFAGSGNEIGFKTASNEWGVQVDSDAEVALYYDGSKKVETTSTGIDVTGAITVNGSPLSSAPTVDLVADGAITANKPVSVQSDGKIKEIKEVAISASNGSATIIDGSQGQSTQISDSCRIGDNKFVAVWVADNDGDKLYAVCCTVSGTTITAGTPVLVRNNAIDRMVKCAYDPVSDALLVVAVTGTGGSAYVKMRAASISGTSLTFGTELSEAHNSAQVISLCSNENGGFLAGWTGNYSSAMQAYTVSGNTITKGSTSNSNLRSDFRPERNAVDIVYHKGDGTYISCWCTDGGDMYGIVSTVTGTSISNGGAQGLGNANNKMAQLAYDEENKQVFCVYYESNKLYGNIWSISGNGISKANDTSFGNENPQGFRVDYNPDVNKAVVIIRDGNGSTAKKTSWAEITNNSGTPQIGSYTQVWSSETQFLVVSYIGKGKFVTVWTGQSEHGYGTVWQRAFTDSTLSEGYVGFSSAAINDTATGTIAVVGNTNSSQSGLTPGKKYYVTRTGGLATSPATPSVEAGTALSSTKLLIKG